MKKFLALTFTLSFSLSACNSDIDLLNDFSSIDSQYNKVSSLSNDKISIKNDWYERLSPDLQKYYSRAKGKTGEELFDILHKITGEDYKASSYGDAKSFMYATADNVKVNEKSGIFDAYSQVFIEGTGGNGGTYKEKGDDNKDGVSGDFINCEHTWPQSFFGKQVPMVSDLHHLQSTLSIPNNRRGHLPFGIVDNSSVVYKTIGGSKLGLMDKTGKKTSLKEKINIINSIPSVEDSKLIEDNFDGVFEPGDKQKGNTARAMLYFYLRYYDKNIRQGDFSQNDFWSSKVPVFINWATKVDLPDEQDRKRDDLIFKKQGNRNPFNDVPEFALLIGENVLKNKR